jgi:hypothetical protein
LAELHVELHGGAAAVLRCVTAAAGGHYGRRAGPHAGRQAHATAAVGRAGARAAAVERAHATAVGRGAVVKRARCYAGGGWAGGLRRWRMVGHASRAGAWRCSWPGKKKKKVKSKEYSWNMLLYGFF